MRKPKPACLSVKFNFCVTKLKASTLAISFILEIVLQRLRHTFLVEVLLVGRIEFCEF